MGEHTPAPWHANIVGDIATIDGEHKFVCHLPAGTRRDANARLIAAAPELLASCVAMLGYMEKGFLVRNTAGDNEDDWALKALAFVKDIQAMHAAIAKATGAK